MHILLISSRTKIKTYVPKVIKIQEIQVFLTFPENVFLDINQVAHLRTNFEKFIKKDNSFYKIEK